MARYQKGWYYSVMEFKPDLSTQLWILGDDVRDFVRANYRSSSFYKIYLINGTDKTLIGSCGNPMAFSNFLRFSVKCDEQYNMIHEK